MALSNSAKLRLFRERAKKGITVYKVPLEEEALITALVSAAWLDPKDTRDKASVEAALQAMLSDWVAAWELDL